MLTVNREPAIRGFATARIRGVETRMEFGRRAMGEAIRYNARSCKFILAGLRTFSSHRLYTKSVGSATVTDAS